MYQQVIMRITALMKLLHTAITQLCLAILANSFQEKARFAVIVEEIQRFLKRIRKNSQAKLPFPARLSFAHPFGYRVFSLSLRTNTTDLVEWSV